MSKNQKNINWNIDFKENKSIVITSGRIANLIELNEDSRRKIYTTSINNNIVFVITNSDENLFSKTRFSIDLSDFVNKSVIGFEDFSSWLIKNYNGSYKMVDSQIWKCK